MLQIERELVERRAAAHGHDLDTPVRLIAGVTANTELVRLLRDENAESDTLNAAADDETQRSLFHAEPPPAIIGAIHRRVNDVRARWR